MMNAKELVRNVLGTPSRPHRLVDPDNLYSPACIALISALHKLFRRTTPPWVDPDEVVRYKVMITHTAAALDEAVKAGMGTKKKPASPGPLSIKEVRKAFGRAAFAMDLYREEYFRSLVDQFLPGDAMAMITDLSKPIDTALLPSSKTKSKAKPEFEIVHLIFYPPDTPLRVGTGISKYCRVEPRTTISGLIYWLCMDDLQKVGPDGTRRSRFSPVDIPFHLSPCLYSEFPTSPSDNARSEIPPVRFESTIKELGLQGKPLHVVLDRTAPPSPNASKNLKPHPPVMFFIVAVNGCQMKRRICYNFWALDSKTLVLKGPGGVLTRYRIEGNSKTTDYPWEVWLEPNHRERPTRCPERVEFSYDDMYKPNWELKYDDDAAYYWKLPTYDTGFEHFPESAFDPGPDLSSANITTSQPAPPPPSQSGTQAVQMSRSPAPITSANNAGTEGGRSESIAPQGSSALEHADQECYQITTSG